MDKLKEYIRNKIEDNYTEISSFVRSVEDRWNDDKSENGRIKEGAFDYVSKLAINKELQDILSYVDNHNPSVKKAENNSKYLEEIKQEKEILKELLNKNLKGINTISLVKDKKTEEIIGATTYNDGYDERFNIEDIEFAYNIDLLLTLQGHRKNRENYKLG